MLCMGAESVTRLLLKKADGRLFLWCGICVRGNALWNFAVFSLSVFDKGRGMPPMQGAVA